MIDLQPDQSAENTTHWLRSHPRAEITSRDRASFYAEAARRAAPKAVQVDDCWHLLHNLTNALIESFVRQR